MFPRLAFLAQIRNTMPSVGIQTYLSMGEDNSWLLIKGDLVEFEGHQDAGNSPNPYLIRSFIEDAARDLLAYRDPSTWPDFPSGYFDALGRAHLRWGSKRKTEKYEVKSWPVECFWQVEEDRGSSPQKDFAE